MKYRIVKVNEKFAGRGHYFIIQREGIFWGWNTVCHIEGGCDHFSSIEEAEGEIRNLRTPRRPSEVVKVV